MIRVYFNLYNIYRKLKYYLQVFNDWYSTKNYKKCIRIKLK